MTISLRKLQESFQEYLLHEKTAALDYISTDSSNAAERIDIYRIGYSLRLLEILEKDFTYFKKYVGDEQFEKLGREYIHHYPSNHFSVCVFSRFFSQYLAEAGYEPHWSEFVAFEWAVASVLDAADAYQLKIADLATISGEQWAEVCFVTHPSVSLHAYSYNVPKLAHAIMWDQPLPDLEYSENAFHYLVWRNQLTSHFEPLTDEQLRVFKAIKSGKNFAEVCESLCDRLPEEEIPPFVAGTLGNWVEKGLFSEFRLSVEV